MKNKGDASIFLPVYRKKIEAYPLFSLFLFIIAMGAVFSFSTVYAKEVLDNPAEFEAAGKSQVDKILKEKNDFEDKYGTSFAFIINSQIQSALYSKTNQGASRAAWYYNLGLEQKLWKDASIHFELEGGHNKGIDKLLPTFSVFNDNSGEVSYAYVNELYLNQALFKEKVFLAAGRLDLSDWFDNNEAANSGDLQFMSSSLVDNLTIPFPQDGLGAMAKFKPVDWFYFQAGSSDANSVSMRVGLNNAFQGAFFIGELGFSPKIMGLQGNYRFIANSEQEKLERIDGSEDQDGNYGYGLSFDQQISKSITLFCRYGFADRRVSEIQHFWSFGGQISQPIAGRIDDVFGIGMAQSILGKDYRQTYETASAETMYEIYYNFSLRPFVKIIPNIQVVTHPDAEKDSSCAVVAGTRLVILF